MIVSFAKMVVIWFAAISLVVVKCTTWRVWTWKRYCYKTIHCLPKKNRFPKAVGIVLGTLVSLVSHTRWAKPVPTNAPLAPMPIVKITCPRMISRRFARIISFVRIVWSTFLQKLIKMISKEQKWWFLFVQNMGAACFCWRQNKFFQEQQTWVVARRKCIKMHWKKKRKKKQDCLPITDAVCERTWIYIVYNRALVHCWWYRQTIEEYFCSNYCKCKASSKPATRHHKEKRGCKTKQE